MGSTSLLALIVRDPEGGKRNYDGHDGLPPNQLNAGDVVIGPIGGGCLLATHENPGNDRDPAWPE